MLDNNVYEKTCYNVYYGCKNKDPYSVIRNYILTISGKFEGDYDLLVVDKCHKKVNWEIIENLINEILDDVYDNGFKEGFETIDLGEYDIINSWIEKLYKYKEIKPEARHEIEEILHNFYAESISFGYFQS